MSRVDGIRESGLSSVACAIQNLWLAATTEGFGVVHTSATAGRPTA